MISEGRIKQLFPEFKASLRILYLSTQSDCIAWVAGRTLNVDVGSIRTATSRIQGKAEDLTLSICYDRSALAAGQVLSLDATLGQAAFPDIQGKPQDLTPSICRHDCSA